MLFFLLPASRSRNLGYPRLLVCDNIPYSTIYTSIRLFLKLPLFIFNVCVFSYLIDEYFLIFKCL